MLFGIKPRQVFVAIGALFVVLACGCATAGAGDGKNELSQAGFQQWLQQFRVEASNSGLSQATLEASLSNLVLNQDVLKRAAYQPEFVKPVWDYLQTAVSKTRVNNGRKNFEQNQKLLKKVAQHYGVAAEVITAIWGLETAYGATFGGFNVLEALATLGYNGRREAFWKQQLLAALEIIQAGDIPADQMIGSWAGAMGHTQFMPTSFQERAVDFNANGKRDIWHELEDVFASTANYLKRAKWQAGETWGVAVDLPADFDWRQADRSVTKPVAEWQDLGVTSLSGAPLPKTAGEAWVLLPAGHQGPAFLALPNFRVIMRYNNSTAYALAIGLLSDQIAGRTPPQLSWPTELQPLNRSQREELQQRLTDAGFDTLGVDGILGSNSRKALRAWQLSNQQVPDGFATLAQLETLREQAKAHNRRRFGPRR